MSLFLSAFYLNRRVLCPPLIERSSPNGIVMRKSAQGELRHLLDDAPGPNVGAAEGCDLLILILILKSRDRSLVALDSAYRGGVRGITRVSVTASLAE
ncbi:hypothetical protein D3C87_1059980 [compost metagenome]